MLCRPDRDDCVVAATRDEALQRAGPLLRAGVPPPSSKARRHRPPCCDAWHLRCYRQPLPIALPMPLVPGRVATGQAVLSAAPCERQSGRMLAIHPTSAPGLCAPLSRSLGDLLCTQFVNSLDDSIATLLRRVDRVRLVGCGTSGRALRPRSPSPPGGRMPGFPLDFERLTAACRQAVRCVCVRDSAPRAPSSLFHVLTCWLRFSLCTRGYSYKPLHCR